MKQHLKPWLLIPYVEISQSHREIFLQTKLSTEVKRFINLTEFNT